MISHAFASFEQIRKYGFAVFGKLSQFMVSQAFARISKDSQMDFRRDSPRIRKCENHGFSQGFAMGTLLMLSLSAGSTYYASSCTTILKYLGRRVGVTGCKNCFSTSRP